METTTPLAATVRTEFGKGPSRQLRFQGQIPAVIYSQGKEPLHVAVDLKELTARLSGEYGTNARFSLQVEGVEKQPVVMMKEYQRDPLRREITHIDFLEIDPSRVFTTRVPLQLDGRPVGVRQGGRLRQVRRDLIIRAKAADIPVAIVADISGLRVNGILRVADVVPPAGVEVIYDSNYALATVTLPRGVTLAEDAEA